MKLNDPQKLINEISVVAKDFNKIKKSLIPQKFILHNKTVNLSILYMNIYIYIYKYIYKYTCTYIYKGIYIYIYNMN